MYLLGIESFNMITDHRPLIPILNEQTLDDIENPRLQRLKEKLAGYSFIVSWKKGKENSIPDALSRPPSLIPSIEDLLADDATLHVSSFIVHQISLADKHPSPGDPIGGAVYLRNLAFGVAIIIFNSINVERENGNGKRRQIEGGKERIEGKV